MEKKSKKFKARKRGKSGKVNLKKSSSESSASSEGSENVNVISSGQLRSEMSSSSFETQDDSAMNELDSKVNAGKSVETRSLQMAKKVCRFCKKMSSPDKMIDPCDCKNASNQWTHLNCLARQMESTNEFSKCGVCKADYKTDRFRLLRKPKGCLDFFKQSRTNFAYLIEIPLSLGFVFFLLALGLIQYEQSYKIVYLKWSIILVFLIILIVLNHIALFLTNIYQLAMRIRRYRLNNFSIILQAK